MTFIQNATTTVVLHGALAKKYGRRHQIGVRSAAEAAYALCALHPGFRADFETGYYRVIRGTVAKGIPLSEGMLTMRIGIAGEIHFLPRAAGGKSGGAGKIILGAVIVIASIAAAVASGGTSLAAELAAASPLLGISYGSIAFFGASILLAGISQAISPQNKNNSTTTDPKTSFGLTGQTNSVTQGSPIPVVYGRMRVGSVVASFGYEAVEYSGSITTAGSGTNLNGQSPPLAIFADVAGPTSGATSSLVAGATGQGGGGKGGSSSGGAHEAPNTLRSDAIVRVIDILSEGPIGGLVDGAKSIFFNNTPLQAADGSYNFQGVSWDVRLGYPEQDPVPGYPAAEETIQVGVQVKQQLPIIRTITSETANAARVTIHLPSLAMQNTTNGDLLAGPDLDYIFECQPIGGAWARVIVEHLSGQKTTSSYQRSYRFALPNVGTATSWNLRMTRLTADATSANIQNETWWDSISVITDHQLIYPNTAYIALTIDAAAFGSQIPTRAYEIDGILCQVPRNYDPVGHTYATSGPGTSMGTWDGASYQVAATSNPAWCLLDMLVNSRYGVGLPSSATAYTAYDLFTIAQYCDGQVPTGYQNEAGVITSELRYAMNVSMATQDDAFRVLQSMVGAFRGMVYWGAGRVVVVADMPTVPSSVLNQSNVIDGDFNYEGTSLKTRHTVARVAWLDPQNSYQTTIEVVEDFQQVVTLGQVSTDIVAFGCTSRGLAHRLGKWLLDTEKTQTDTLSTKTGMEHLRVRPGDVTIVSDAHYAGVRMGGRCLPGSTRTSVNFDSAFPTSGELEYVLTVALPDGSVATEQVIAGIGLNSAVNGPNNIASMQVPLALAPAAYATWVLSARGAPGPHGPASVFPIEGRQFRVLALVEPNRGTFTIAAVNHDPNKYARVEFGLKFDPTPYSQLNSLLASPLPPPTNVFAKDYITGVGTTTLVRVTVSFTPANDPRVTTAEVRAVGPEQRSTSTTGSSADFDGLQLGTYIFGVRSAGRDGRTSAWVDTDPVLVDGVADAPADIHNLTATGGALSVALTWGASSARDLLHYEVWRAGAVQNGTHPFPITTYVPTGTPAQNNAVLVSAVQATSFTDYGDNLGPDEAWAYWVRPVNTTLAAGSFVGPVRALTTYYLTNNLEEAIRNTAPIAQALLGSAPIAVQTLPATGYEGQLAFQASDQKLYRWSGAANGGNGAWVAYIPIIPDNNGMIPASIVSGIAAAVIGNSLTSDQITQVLNAVGTEAVTSDQITSVVGSKVSGVLSNASITAGRIYDVDSNGNLVQGINTNQLLGTIAATKITDVDPVTGQTVAGVSAAKLLGTVDLSKIPTIPTTKLTGDILAASSASLDLTSSRIMGKLAAASISGQLVAAQIASIPATIITGPILPAQISGVSAATIQGSLSSDQIAGLDAAKITGAITSTQIGPNQVTTPNLAAGAVTATTIAAGAVTTAALAVGSASNVLSNSCFTIAPDCWACMQAPTATAVLPILGSSNQALWAFDGNGGCLFTGSGLQAITASYLDLAYTGPNPQANNVYYCNVPVSPGQVWEAQVSVITNPNTTVELFIVGDDAAGHLLWATSTAAANFATPANGNLLSNWRLLALQQTIPAGVVTITLMVRLRYTGTGTGTASAFITRALLGQTTVGALTSHQTLPWVPGGVTTITGGSIATNSISARQIVAGSITATQIAAGSITADRILAGSITATQLAAATITATQIAAGTITAAQISARTITAGLLQAGSITATEIAAGAITTAALAVGSPNNSITNSCFAVSSDGWAGALPVPIVGTADAANFNLDGVGAGKITSPLLAINAVSDSVYTNGQTGTGRAFDASVPAVAGETWEAQAAFIAIRGSVQVYILFVDALGNLLAGNPSALYSDTPAASGLTLANWHTIAVRTTAPLGTVAVGMLMRVQNTSGSPNTCGYYLTRTLLGKTVPNATGNLAWTPGGVTSIGGGIIQTNAIVARTIAAGAITVGKIDAGAVTATNLAIGSSTNVISNPSCVASTDGWVVYGPAGAAISFNLPGYTLNGEGTGFAAYTGTLGASVALTVGWQPNGGYSPCVGGNWYECQARIASHRTASLVQLQFLRADGSLAGVDGSAPGSVVGNRIVAAAGVTLAGYGLSWAKGVAPNDAVSYRMLIYASTDAIGGYANSNGSDGGVNPYLFFTQASLGTSTPVAMALSQPQPYAPGGVTEITGGVIKANTIVGAHLVAGSVTADKLTIGSGANVIWNSCLTIAADGWAAGGAPTAGGYSSATGITITPSTIDVLPAYGCGILNSAPMAAGIIADAVWRPLGAVGVPCLPGQAWEAQAQVIAAGAGASIHLFWYKADGTGCVDTTPDTIGTVSLVATDKGHGGATLDQFTKLTVIGTAPSNAAYVTIGVRMQNSTTAGSFVVFTQTMLAQTVANATQVSIWQPGGNTVLTGGMIQTNTITARQIAANSITTAQLAVGSSANRITNSCCAVTTENWSAAALAGSSIGIFASCSSAYTQYATSDGCGVVETRLAAGGFVDVRYAALSIVGGDTLEAQAMLLPQQSLGSVYLEYLDANHTHLAYSVFSNVVANVIATPAGIGTLAPFRLASLIDNPAPAAAVYAVLILRFNSPQASEADGLGVFTRVGLGKTVAGAAQVSTWAPGGITAISAGMVQTNAIVARTIAAGAITADKLTVASAGNVIGNPTCPVSSWGWVNSGTCPGTVLGSVTGDGAAPASYALAGEGSGVISATTMSTAQFMEAYWDPDTTGGVACNPGDWWEAQAYLAAHRCYARVQIEFYDINGTVLSVTAGNRIAGPGGGPTLGAYGFSWTKALAPANAVRARMVVAGLNDNGADIVLGVPGQGPYVFFTHCVLGRSTSLAIAAGAQPQPYQVGGVTQIVGGAIKTGSITARSIGAGQITANLLAVGSPSNVIYNGCGYPNAVGWSANPGITLGVQAPTDPWGLLGYGSASLYIPTMPGGSTYDVTWSPGPVVPGTAFGASVPCSPGDLWEGQARVMTHRCSAQLFVVFTNGGVETGANQTTPISVSPPGNGHTLSQYQLLSVRAVAPAGTTAVTLLLRMGNDNLAATVFPGTNGTNSFLFFTQAALGPVAAPNSAQPLAWTPGGVTSINGGVIQTGTILAQQLAANSVTAVQIQAGSIVASKIAAGAITAQSLAIGSPANLIWNSCPDQGCEGWSRYTFGPNMPAFGTPLIQMDAATVLQRYTFALQGLGSGFAQYIGSSGLIYSNQGFVFDWAPTAAAPYGFPVGGTSRTYGGAVSLVAANNMQAFVQLIFFDSSGNAIPGGDFTSAVVANNAGTNAGAYEDCYQRVSVVGVAPPGSATVVLRVVGTGIATGANDPAFAFTKAQLAVLPTGATVVGDWVPGGVTTISGNMIKTGTLDASRINTGTLAAATGFIQTLTAQTVTAGTITAKLVGTNKLTAGSIDVDNLVVGGVKAGAIGADQIASNAIFARHLAAEQVITLSAQIGVGVINSALIGNATIGTANIGDLTVNGQKISPGAITQVSWGATPGGGAQAIAYTGITVIGNSNGVLLMIRANLPRFGGTTDTGGGGGGEGGGSGA